jgi:hypothetical protein
MSSSRLRYRFSDTLIDRRPPLAGIYCYRPTPLDNHY